MKIMLWSLLALNGVAALLWMAGVTVPATSRPQAPPPALAAQRLELLSELPVPPARLAESDDELPPSIAPTDGPTPAIVPDTPQADAAAAPAPASAAAPSGAPVAATGAAGGEAASSPVAGVESPVEVTPPAPQAAPPPADVAQPSQNSPPADASAPPADAVAVAPGTAPTCFRTPEFAPDARERVEGALRGAGFEQVALKSSVRPRYWVYWSGTPGAAGQVEQALKTAGVRDWYRVGGGRDATISLGVYGQMDGARRRQRELAAKGIQATVGERYAAQARLHWQVTAPAAAVESARAQLERQRVSLKACR